MRPRVLGWVPRPWRAPDGSGAAWPAPGLLRQGNIYVLSSALSQGLMLAAWLCLPWYLTVGELGQFALISFGTELLTRVILMGTDAGIVRFYADDVRRGEVLRTAHVWLAVGGAIAALLVWLTRRLVPALIPWPSNV